jgi:hypothetical protein
VWKVLYFRRQFKLTTKSTNQRSITEESENVYLEDYVIPKGREKADIKIRENVVWAMLGKWLSQNPLRRKKR